MKSRLRSFFWRVPVETEVNEELAGHIELQTQRYIREGLDPAEARARAIARFGDPSTIRQSAIQIRSDMETDMRRSEFRDELRQDAAFALRGFRRAPLFTLVAVVTIAIGVGANTAIFSVVNTVLLRPLPYPNAERIVTLSNAYRGDELEKSAVAGGEMFDFRETFKSLDQVAGIRASTATLTGPGGEPEPLNVTISTPNLFDVLGERAFLGRAFIPTEGRPNEPRVVVLSYSLWKRRFGGDSSIVGKQIILNDIPRTVVGVMRDGMRFPDGPVGYASARTDIWTCDTQEATRTPNQRGNQNLVVLGRLAPNATQAQVERDLAATIARFKRELPDRYAKAGEKEWTLVSSSLRDEMVGTVRPALFMFTAAVAIVLLIACVNVANLLLARTALRQRELAVRLALGASRKRILRQLVTESTILAMMGGALGAVLAALAIKGLRTYGIVEMPQLAGTRMDFVVLAFTFGVSALAGVCIGLVPALQQSAATPGMVLGAESKGASGGMARRRLRTALVVAQVAMALVVLNTAGLLGRSFVALQRVEPGFQPEGVMSAYVSLPRRLGGPYDSTYKVSAFFEKLAANLASMPGVTSVGGIYPLPVSNDRWSGSFDIEGRPEDKVTPHSEYAAAMPGYFKTMGIPIRGREFTSDDQLGRTLTAVIDEELAKKYWPGEDPIGKRVSQDAESGNWMTIIGVAGHVHRDGPAVESEGQLYMSYLQRPQGFLYAIARTTAPPTTLIAPMRQAVRSLDANVPVSKQRSLADLQHESIARQRFNVTLTAFFAIAALALASIGLYGVMSYLVAQRTREIGIRVALGGQPSDVRGMVVKEAVAIAVIGLGVGTLGSLALSRGLEGFLFGITPTDPVTYGTIAVLLLAVAAGASFGPARRATRVDPLTALRD
jgi:predicted permease